MILADIELTIRAVAVTPKGMTVAFALLAALGDLWGHLSHTDDWNHVAASVLSTFFVTWLLCYLIFLWR